MATISQIRGMLLEEALLFLLRRSGYRTIEQANSDPTLNDGAAGLEVKGRGHRHQIDAVADYIVAQPFSHPQRLLLEAKFYTTKSVGIEVARNGVGVLKDVSEYWAPRKSGVSEKRYHYQYAVFSASGYTENAQRYAFAQDIFLIQLERSPYIQPVVQAIERLSHHSFGAPAWDAIDINLSELRKAVRAHLRGQPQPVVSPSTERAHGLLTDYFEGLDQIRGALLGMIDRQFPVLLTPDPDLMLADLRDHYRVSIHFDETGWYLRDMETRQLLFSFDLPEELFRLYAESDLLDPARALDMKEERMSHIQATVSDNDTIRFIVFELDAGWLQRVRDELETRDTN